MKLMTKSTEQLHQTLTLFEELRLSSSVEHSALGTIAAKDAKKTHNKIDPNIKAAERIAKQLQRKSKGRSITVESRRKGDEICEHLISALKNQPVQGKLVY